MNSECVVLARTITQIGLGPWLAHVGLSIVVCTVLAMLAQFIAILMLAEITIKTEWHVTVKALR